MNKKDKDLFRKSIKMWLVLAETGITKEEYFENYSNDNVMYNCYLCEIVDNSCEQCLLYGKFETVSHALSNKCSHLYFSSTYVTFYTGWRFADKEERKKWADLFAKNQIKVYEDITGEKYEMEPV